MAVVKTQPFEHGFRRLTIARGQRHIAPGEQRGFRLRERHLNQSTVKIGAYAAVFYAALDPRRTAYGPQLWCVQQIARHRRVHRRILGKKQLGLPLAEVYSGQQTGRAQLGRRDFACDKLRHVMPRFVPR